MLETTPEHSGLQHGASQDSWSSTIRAQNAKHDLRRSSSEYCDASLVKRDAGTRSDVKDAAAHAPPPESLVGKTGGAEQEWQPAPVQRADGAGEGGTADRLARQTSMTDL